MMQELIAITGREIGGVEVNSVNARELHKQLESRQDFSNWIRDRLADFSEGSDYIIIENIVKAGNGTSKRKDYIITLDTAKHIALAERNEKGKQVRAYFIEVEKQATKILSPMEILELQFKAHRELAHKTNQLEHRLDKLVDESVLTTHDAHKVKKSIDCKIEEWLTKHSLPSIYRKKLYKDLYGKLYDTYEVTSYKDLPRYRLDEVINYITTAEVA